MRSDTPLDNMDLPKTNPNEELETLSRSFFEPLFPPEKFELRSEAKEKGIDYDIELKHSGKSTNLRLLVQLKAHHQAKINLDGSISHSIRTSNIQYLLNGGKPAYYILFVNSNTTFYSVSIGEFVRELMNKDEEWDKQPNHTIRFKQVLTPALIDDIYNLTMKEGLFKRQISEKLIEASMVVGGNNRISFDAELEIKDDQEIQSLLERTGLDLINSGKWKDVLFIHKKATGFINGSSLYDLAIGLAYYYEGSFYLALNHLKKAGKHKDDLISALRNHLRYFLELSELHLGIRSSDKFIETMNELESKSHLGLYIEIDRARNEFNQSENENFDRRYETLEKQIQSVIDNPECSKNIELIARAELLYAEGQANNVSYFQSVAKINHLENMTGPNLELRTKSLAAILRRNKQWHQDLRALMKEIEDCENLFVLNMTQLYYVKVMYEHDVYTRHIKVVQPFPGMEEEEISGKGEIINPLINILNGVINFYNEVHFVENLIVGLALRYELLDYMDENDKAKKLIIDLEELGEERGTLENKLKIQSLKNRGTTHERFADFFGDDIINAYKYQKEYEQLVSEMRQMDQHEKKQTSPEHKNAIELFPIGHFSFHIDNLDKVFSILKISNDKLQKQIASMLKQGITPVVNLLPEEIKKEGYLNGNNENRGITSWRNVHRIRKAFFDKSFFRIDLFNENG